jgi:GH15 family glucan-1,4-alpha-glucosidase
VRRAYRDATLILETLFETRDGSIRLIDFMPIGSPTPSIVRIVEGVRGEVACSMELRPRPNYGELTPWSDERDGRWIAVLSPDGIALDTPVPRHDAEGSALSRFSVREGERIPFVLQWFSPHDPLPPRLDPEGALRETLAWWIDWSAHFRYDGPEREAVLRSALTLKALTFARTGAIVAAATTSLPEELGAAKNWDYRYCWLRDSAFAVEVFAELGLLDEARAWRDWFLRVYGGRPANLHIMYGIGGERLEGERSAPWLPGFAKSAPVRIANDAHDQFQLGVYGNVFHALDRANAAGVELTREHWTMLEPLLDFIESAWQIPGNGIWETRDSGRQYVDSKVMSWVAVDRALKIAGRCGFPVDVARWERFKSVVHDEVCRAGFDPTRNAFTQYYGSRELDASLLQMPILGFLPPDDPRVIGTVAAIERELVVDGFVFRYSADIVTSGEDPLPVEGAFVMCTFWLAVNYALAGREAEARATFDRMFGVANDVGLLAEEYDVRRKVQLGNFPQAFSHIGLVRAAQALGFKRGG